MVKYVTFCNLSVLMLSLFLVSCQKDIEKTENDSSLLFFPNTEDYNKQKVEISKMNFEEIKAWVKNKDFNSFGIASQEKLEEANPENFQNISQLKEFVNNNSRYIEFTYGDTPDDITLEAVLSTNSDRYFMNIDHMYRIGNDVFKVLKYALVSTSISNKEKLFSINENNFKQVKDTTIKVQAFKTISSFDEYVTAAETKFTYDWNDTYIEARQTDNKERTLVTFSSYRVQKTNTSCLLFTDVHIRPYKKTLGIWYYCTRTISGRVKWRMDVSGPGNGKFYCDEEIPKQKVSVWDKRCFSPDECYTLNPFFYWVAMDSRVKNESIPNPFLIQIYHHNY